VSPHLPVLLKEFCEHPPRHRLRRGLPGRRRLFGRQWAKVFQGLPSWDLKEAFWVTLLWPVAALALLVIVAAAAVCAALPWLGRGLSWFGGLIEKWYRV
jgi:hypothetical protein